MQEIDGALAIACRMLFAELIRMTENISPFHGCVEQQSFPQVVLDPPKSGAAIRSVEFAASHGISQGVAAFDPVERRKWQRLCRARHAAGCPRAIGIPADQ